MIGTPDGAVLMSQHRDWIVTSKDFDADCPVALTILTLETSDGWAQVYEAAGFIFKDYGKAWLHATETLAAEAAEPISPPAAPIDLFEEDL